MTTFKEREILLHVRSKNLLDELFAKVDEFNKRVYGIEKTDYSGLVEKIVATK